MAMRVTSLAVSLLHFRPQCKLPSTLPSGASELLQRRSKRHRAWDWARAHQHLLEEGFVSGPAPIVRCGVSVLRQPAKEVPPEMIGSDKLRALVDTMLETMRAAPGVGLAAPQIGVPLQVIVLEDREEYIAVVPPETAAEQGRAAFGPLVIINPALTSLGGQGARFFEGCLSVPGYQALVERYTEVECSGLTWDGQPLALRASGWQARILQHEVDHLRGTLYVDRMLSRSFAARGSGVEGLTEDVPALGPCTCCHAIDTAA